MIFIIFRSWQGKLDLSELSPSKMRWVVKHNHLNFEFNERIIVPQLPYDQIDAEVID
jgi:hypothetical protein